VIGSLRIVRTIAVLSSRDLWINRRVPRLPILPRSKRLRRQLKPKRMAARGDRSPLFDLTRESKSAFIALVIAFPMALSKDWFISEYAPVRFRSFLVALIDLMADIPRIISGFGVLAARPQAKFWLVAPTQNLGGIPILQGHADPNSASWAQSDYVASAFISGICVAMMVIPIACAVFMRGSIAQAPIIEREAATSWRPDVGNVQIGHSSAAAA